jgi:hypothetical protein
VRVAWLAAEGSLIGVKQWNITGWRAGGVVTQVVEHLPSKCEALSSNLNTEKKKKRGWNGD